VYIPFIKIQLTTLININFECANRWQILRSCIEASTDYELVETLYEKLSKTIIS